MFMIPTAVFSFWFFGLLSFGLIGYGIHLLHEWYRHSWSYDLVLQRSYFDPHLGWNSHPALLAAGIGLLVWALAGGLIVRGILSLAGKAGARAEAEPGPLPAGAGRSEEHHLRRPDGTLLHVETYGPEDGVPIVLTHGWGANGAEWNYLKRELGGRFRLILWDLPGLGRSTRPANRDYSLENLAGDLEAVLGLAGGRPAILLGHSIGGMITLTFCRLFPEALGRRVAGLVLVHTTYTNPVRTTKGAAIYTALEKPVIVPLLHLTIWLSPLVRLMMWSSYLNGSAHLSTKRSGFAGTETPGQVEFITRFQLQAPPAVLARGMFGMLAYDATAVLPSIHVPTLVVPGDRDSTCLPEASGRMHRDIPGSQLTPLAPAKHMGLIEHHGRFAKLVGEFAAACGGRG